MVSNPIYFNVFIGTFGKNNKISINIRQHQH